MSYLLPFNEETEGNLRSVSMKRSRFTCLFVFVYLFLCICICVFERKEAEGNLRLASLKHGSLKGEDLGSPIAICIDDANDNHPSYFHRPLLIVMIIMVKLWVGRIIVLEPINITTTISIISIITIITNITIISLLMMKLWVGGGIIGLEATQAHTSRLS